MSIARTSPVTVEHRYTALTDQLRFQCESRCRMPSRGWGGRLHVSSLVPANHYKHHAVLYSSNDGSVRAVESKLARPCPGRVDKASNQHVHIAPLHPVLSVARSRP